MACRNCDGTGEDGYCHECLGELGFAYPEEARLLRQQIADLESQLVVRLVTAEHRQEQLENVFKTTNERLRGIVDCLGRRKIELDWATSNEDNEVGGWWGTQGDMDLSSVGPFGTPLEAAEAAMAQREAAEEAKGRGTECPSQSRNVTT